MNLALRAHFFWVSLFVLSSNSMAHLGEDPDHEGPRVAEAMEWNASRETPIRADSRKQAFRLLLKFKLREIRNRIDSLREDSLHVPPEERPRFRRAFLTAAKVLAEAEGRLGELKGRESEADPRKWETMRARMERTLFGLDRFLTETEALWFPAVKLEPPWR